MIDSDTYELVQLGQYRLDMFNTHYNKILEQIEDKNASKEVRRKLIDKTVDVIKGKERNEQLNVHIPTKEKRNRKLKDVLISIETVLSSLEQITGDVNREKRQKQYVEYLKHHKAQVSKLLDDKIPVDIEFGTIDYNKRPQITKKSIVDYLEKTIKEYNIKISKKFIQDAVETTTQ